MSFPDLIRGALSRVGDLALPGITTDQATCQGSKHHSPQPLLVNEVLLANGESVLLCGTCEDNLLVLQRLLDAHNGSLPWPVRRCFGNIIRAIAESTWQGEQASVAPVTGTPHD